MTTKLIAGGGLVQVMSQVLLQSGALFHLCRREFEIVEIETEIVEIESLWWQ